MNSPFGGISIYVCMVIIAVKYIWRRASPDNSQMSTRLSPRAALFASVTIITLMTSAYFFLYGSTITAAMVKDNNNFESIYYAFHTCTPPPAATQEKKIVLRLDDVQSEGWTDLSIQMMTDAHQHQLPMVAGVIPYQITRNPALVRFFERHGCAVEIAMHGYTHGIGKDGGDGGTGEFSNLTTVEALDRIDKSEIELAKITSEPIVTFIPPNNEISKEAAEAVKFRGMKTISSDDQTKFGYDIGTFPYEKHYVTPEEILARCDLRWSKGDELCVIMLHPQEFSDKMGNKDSTRYKEYIQLLDMIAARNDVSVVTFRDLLRQ